jgi:hypothetical protein
MNDRRDWKVFLEENIKIVQSIDDQLGTEKT